MGKNYLQLEINGQLYGLKFNIGTYNNVRQATGLDPFKYLAASEGFDDIIPYAKVIIKAALLSNCQSKGETVEYTDKEIDDLVTEMSPADLQIIITMYNNPVDSKPSVNGEVSKHTQSGNNLG